MGLVLTLIYAALVFLSVPHMVPALAPYRPLLILAALAVLGSIPNLLQRAPVLLNAPWWLMTAFWGVVLLSWLPHGWLGGTLKGFFGFTPDVVPFFLIAINVRSLLGLRLLRLALLGATAYILAQGLWQYHTSPGESPYVMVQPLEGLEEPLRRLQGVGVLGDPNHFAQYLVALLPFLFVTPTQRLGIAMLGRLPMALLFLYGIYLTRSRGGLMGVAALVGLAAAERVKWVGAGLASGIAVVALMAVGFTGGREVSLEAGMDRLNIWSDGLGMFKSSPLWGSGYGSFPDAFQYTAHNSVLLCAAELGLVGCFFWIGSLFLLMAHLGEVIKPAAGVAPHPELQRWAKAVRLGLSAFLMTSFFLSRTYAAALYMLLGLAAAVANLEAERRGLRSLGLPKNWAGWILAISIGSIALIYVLVRLRAV